MSDLKNGTQNTDMDKELQDDDLEIEILDLEDEPQETETQTEEPELSGEGEKLQAGETALSDEGAEAQAGEDVLSGEGAEPLPEEPAAAQEESEPAWEETEIPDEKPERQEGLKPAKPQQKPEPEASVLDDLEFISEESVKDKSRMASGEPIRDEFVSKKKTTRRSVDEYEAKRERSVGFFRSHIVLIVIICVVIAAAVCALGILVKNHKEKMAEKNAGQTISEQEYEKDEHQEINDLITAYFDAYAKGDTDAIQQYANPLTDKEKSYISQYSQFVDHYENITCYTKAGADANSYIVSVALQIRFKDVETPAPGLDFFYVRTGEDGKVYIDNTYSTFNLLYQENPLDANIQQLITDYQAGEDVVALQASVQTQYEAALEKDENLNKMINETVAQAISAWENGEAANQQAAQQQAAQQVQQEEQAAQEAAAQQAAAQEAAKKAAEQEAAKKAEAEKPKVTSFDEGTRINLTAAVNIRESMSESSKRVGLAYAGETVTVIMSYDEGWTKVNWNDKTGYIRTDILAGM